MDVPRLIALIVEVRLDGDTAGRRNVAWAESAAGKANAYAYAYAYAEGVCARPGDLF